MAVRRSGPWKGAHVAAHSLHGAGRRGLHQDGGEPLEKGCVGRDPSGARGNQAQAGLKHPRWGRQGATAWAFQRERCLIQRCLDQPSRCKGPSEGQAAWELECLCQANGGALRKAGRGGGRGGMWERKSCVGKIAVLWLLFEAVLAALRQTVGLGKNTPQTGREAAEFSQCPSSSLSGLSPQKEPQARPKEDPAAGGGGVSK